MKLTDVLSEEMIKIPLSARDKEGVLAELVEVVAAAKPVTDKTALLKAIKDREKLMSTGVGKGIAIPHCRSLILSKFTLAVGRFPAGVPFDALDKKSSHLFFLVAAPPRDKGNQYLLTLGAIAKVAKDLGKNDKLCTSQTPEEFLARLKELEAKGK